MEGVAVGPGRDLNYTDGHVDVMKGSKVTVYRFRPNFGIITMSVNAGRQQNVGFL